MRSSENLLFTKNLRNCPDIGILWNLGM